MSDEQTTKSLQEQARLLKEQEESLKRIADLYKEQGSQAESVADAVAHAERAEKNQLKHLTTKRDLAQKNLEIIEEQIGAGALQGDEAAQAIEAANKKLAIEEDILKNLEDQIAAAQKLADEYQRGIDSAENSGARIASTLFGVDEGWKNTWWGNLASGDFSAKISAMGKGFKTAMAPANVLGGLMMKVQESTFVAALAFDNASSQLAAATGQGTRYNDMIMSVAEETRSFGVGIQGAAAAIQGLNESMSGFSQVSSETQTALVKQAATLERLGVSAQTTGKITDQLTKGMGMSAEQAMQTNNELARAAMGIGVPVGKMAQEFENAMPALAHYGKEAPKIFKKVMAAAKGLGVEMNTLLGFTSQFDTFEGAATAVGKLNNILGGDLFNSYEMINATEEERIELMLRNLELSGKSFDSMDRFEKKALANAAGITDMAEANKLFSGGLSAYQKAQADVEANAVSQKELEKRTQAAVSVQEKMNQVFESFAILVQPIVEGLHSLFNILLKVNDMTGGMLMPILFGLAGAYYVVAKAAGFNVAAKKADIGATLTETAVTNADTIAKGAHAGATAADTAATAGDTIATNANNVSKNMGIVATLRQAAVTAMSTARTIFSTIAEKAAAAARFLLAKASAFAAVAMGKQAVAQSAVTATAAPAGGMLAALAAGMAALGTPPALLGILAMAALAAGIGLVVIGIALAVKSIVGMVQTFAEMPELIVPATIALFGFLAGLTAVVLGVSALAPFAAVFIAAAANISAGLIALSPGLLIFSVALATFGAALKLIGGREIATMLGLSLAIFPFAIAMNLASGLIASAAIVMAPGMMMLGVGFMMLGAGLTIMTLALPAMALLIPILPMFAAALSASAVPFAIGATLIGATAGLLGLGLAQLGLGLLVATLGIPAMFLLASALPIFGAGLIAAAPSLALGAALIAPVAGALGAAFAMLGAGVALATLGIPGMFLLAAALPLFALGLTYAAPMMVAAAVGFAPAALMLGLGIGALGLSLLLFDEDTLEIMTAMVIALPIFALGLLAGSAILALASMAFLLPALGLALALGAFGVALKLFDGKTLEIMTVMPLALIPFSIGLLAASFILSLAAAAFLTPAITLATALGAFGLALKLFGEEEIAAMGFIALTIVPFALAMGFAGRLLAFAGKYTVIGAAFTAAALAILGLGVRALPNNFADMLLAISIALVPFATALAYAALPMFIGGILFGIGALSISPGLTTLGDAFRTLPENMATMMMGLSQALVPFATAVRESGLKMLIGGVLFGAGASILAPGLITLGDAFKQLPANMPDLMGQLAPILVPFATAVAESATPMFFGAPLFAVGAMILYPGLVALGRGFKELTDNMPDLMAQLTEVMPPFASALLGSGFAFILGAMMWSTGALILAPGMYALSGSFMEFALALVMIAPHIEMMTPLAHALQEMGKAMLSFGLDIVSFGLMSIGLFPVFKIGLGMMISTIKDLSAALETVPFEKTRAIADFLNGLVSLTGLENIADTMFTVAQGVGVVSDALRDLPAEQTIAMSQLMTSVAEASVKVTPEGVENVKNLVEQASVYASVQAEFKAPSVDAFVQALKQVNSDNASSGSGSGSGKDIILELNGRELGKAIDVHLEDKHNLRTN